ncbi:MAG TPA: alpha/beta hydrolase [Acetobacteraceae bacterium]|nr:alpha/beta hydrolase [Acetobacteraceae bacterium]
MRVSAGAKLLLAGGALLGAIALANRYARPRVTPPPARRRSVQVDGVRLFYLEQGEGTPIVLLHGNGAMAEDFAASGILDRLAVRHRVIAFDRPGFGESERPSTRIWTFPAQADLLRRALVQMGIARPVLVGHSAGCLAALHMALHDPQDTAALVLLSGFYFPRLRPDMLITSLWALPGLRWLAASAAAHLFGWLALPGYLRVVFAPNRVPERFRRSFPLAAVLRPRHLMATIADTPLLLWDPMTLPRCLDRLRMPVTIMTGTQDRIVMGRLQSRRLHQAVPGSRLHALEGIGHMIHHAEPDAVIAAIEQAADAAQRRLGADGIAPENKPVFS